MYYIMQDLYKINRDKYENLNNILYGGSEIKYYTHDNGGKPFEVRIKSKNVSIYKQSKSDKYDDFICTFKAKKIFIGRSPIEGSLDFDGKYEKEYDGNSILLYLGNKNRLYKYVFIGDSIFLFTTNSKIYKYISPVGNSDVTWPYGIDKNNIYYLFREGVSIKVVKYTDPYEFLYDASKISNIKASNDQSELIYPNFDDIKEFYIDDKPYNLMFLFNPSEHYRYIKSLNKKMHAIKTNGKKVIYSEKDYVDLMKRFGKMIQIKEFQNRKEINERTDNNLLGFYKSVIAEYKEKN
jgi:hypothetical protein